MARTHSSYTASPTRFRSPQRSPTRRPNSEDGSQYEMDLDALGLNSTFDSTGLDDSHVPKVDVVDTSDIEGPEDFTMNMTYWMTADFPLSQIRSRKEKNVKLQETRSDARYETEGTQETTTEVDKAIIGESIQDRNIEEDFNSASPTMRANGTTDAHPSSKAPSESSMENEEKVRSYLSALPDTDLGEALTSTPLRIAKQNMLQVPSPAAPKARSLQATVEDYDTPRKPTQETVIHHVPDRATGIIDTTDHDVLQKRLSELQSRLEQQGLASRTRITELETILSYTRSELEAARTDNYKHKEQIGTLEREKHSQTCKLEAARSSTETKLKAQEDELNAKMQEFGEELRLQNLAKLQNQREEFEKQLRALEESKRIVDKEVEARGQLVDQARSELDQLQRSNGEKLLGIMSTQPVKQQQNEQGFSKERDELNAKLSMLQTRADTLQADLQKATVDARCARKEAQEKAALYSSAELANQNQASRISDLELRLQSVQPQLEFTQAAVVPQDEQLSSQTELALRLKDAQSQLDALRADAATKEQQLRRTSDLDGRLQILQSQLDSSRADVTTKDQQILRQIEEQERLEQRLSTSQGRVEGLETTVSSLRQQLAEALRDSAKTRTDVERFEKDLENANERLQDARADADRRVKEIEKKLNKSKELKCEAENKLKELQSHRDELIEDHEAKLENVRSNAEDAVRKVGALVEQERAEKKRIVKELKKTSAELQQLRSENKQKNASEEEEDSSDESTRSIVSSQTNAKDAEIEKLRILIRNQASEMKTIKADTASLRKENQRLKTSHHETSASQPTIQSLEIELTSLRRENSTLKAELQAREEDFEAVNKAMDERLAAMLGKVLKERAKMVVGKRDGQWAESVGKVKDERELMGRMLLREWGRQEVGVAREEEGERQAYRYQYVKRS